ncbi:MAG: GWxTD domain-containing protein, partial [Calditrichaeota bacterium]
MRHWVAGMVAEKKVKFKLVEQRFFPTKKETKGSLAPKLKMGWNEMSWQKVSMLKSPGRQICLAVLLSFAASLFSAIPTTVTALPQLQDSLHRAIELVVAGEAEEATSLYYKILESSPDDSVAAQLFADIKDILTVAEITSYKQASDKGQWLLRFWQRLDPTPATPANERLVEHYRRLHVARNRYRSPQPRGYDDRGMIYVRYGEPDEIYSAALGSLSRYGNVTRENESWVYHRLGDVNFDFVEYGGLYRLEVDLRKAIESVPQNLKGSIILWRDLFEQRQHLNIRYQTTANKLERILYSMSEDIPPQVALAQAERAVTFDYIARSEEKQRALPRYTTDFDLQEKRFDMIVSSAIFAQAKTSNLKNDQSRLEFYWAIPLQQLRSANLFQKKANRDLKMYFSIFTKDYQPVVRKNETIALDLAALLAQKDYLGQLTFFLQPDTYRVALDIRSPQTNQRGMMQMLVDVPEFPRDRLSLSDIELASMVRPATEED